MHDRIFLVGFRATGKTTVGKELARELDWEFFDMDDEIVKRAGKSIAELTEGGKSWQEFRQLEQDVLAELIRREKVVVGMGGGAPVNNIVKEGTGVTFGRRNAEMLVAEKAVLTVLLTALDDVVYQRIKADEIKTEGVTRPILDEERARELEEKLEIYENDLIKQKEVIVEEILNDSMLMFQERKSLYEALADVVVDTGKLEPVEAAKEIIKHL